MTEPKVANLPTTDLSHIFCGNQTEIWLRFKNSAVNDLAWVIFSPDLVEKELGNSVSAGKTLWGLPDSQQAVIHWLTKLDENISLRGLPDRYTLTIKQSPQRLGVYFEQLIAFALQSLPAVKTNRPALLAQNIQINEDGITAGEFDFLLQDQQNQLLHVEAAVKFFLLPQKASLPYDPMHWLGPNAKDKLGLKIDHLLAKQLTLFQRSKAARKKALQLNGNPTSCEAQSQYLVKGMFFIHWSALIAQPAIANAECLMGHWIHEKELKNLIEANKTSQYFTVSLLKKTEWLTGNGVNNPLTAFDLPSPSAIPYMLELTHQPEHSFADDVHTEKKTSRLMVVNNYWPEINSPSRMI
ncbi:DUF1853 family protein [Teredinibacter purpureus]|uniref:DUF1853 family protein n=1 Tax=Teredinibacter purpureus TaxID=2731756 RepID=UPI000696A304|nr:DUF1853 family protein [Teredinibacter purpureus]